MDFSALIADLRTIASRYNGRDTDRNVSTAMYCEMFRKILQKAENGVTEYGDQIVILWMTLSQLCNTYQTLTACPARDSLYQHIFLLCAKVVLNIKWQQLPEDDQGKVNFSQTIANTHKQLVKTGFNRFELLTHLMENPWTDPTLSKIMSGDDKDESSGSDTETEETEREKERKQKEKVDEIANYINKEDPLILKLRVEMLILENCEDFASNLCNCLVRYNQFKEDLDLREMQFVLLHKLNQMEKLQEECEQIVCHFGIKIINRLEQKESNQQLCIRLVQIFLVQDWINPDRNCCTKELLKLWIRHQYMADKDRAKFLENVWSIAKLSSKTEQICLLISGLQKECGVKLRQLYTDLCVYAINIDKGGCEKEMMQGNMEGLKERQKAMAATCEKLAGIVAMNNLKAAKISALTAFALNPSRTNLCLVEKMYMNKTIVQASIKKKERKKDRRETHDGEVNLATLYEVERLLNMLRPYYLNPDLKWEELLPVCQKFMAEKGTTDVKNTQNEQKEKMSKSVKEGLMQYYCDDTAQFVPAKQMPKDSILLGSSNSPPKSPWTNVITTQSTKPSFKETTKLIPYSKLQNMSIQGSPLDMSKGSLQVQNKTPTDMSEESQKKQRAKQSKPAQFDFAKLLEATKNLPQMQTHSKASTTQGSAHLPYVPGLTTQEVQQAMIQHRKNLNRSFSVDQMSSSKQASTLSSQGLQIQSQSHRTRALSLERQQSTSHLPSNSATDLSKPSQLARITSDKSQSQDKSLMSFQESFVRNANQRSLSNIIQSNQIEVANEVTLASSTSSTGAKSTPVAAPRSRQPSKEELQSIVDWLQTGTEDAKVKPQIVIKHSHDKSLGLVPKQKKQSSNTSEHAVKEVTLGTTSVQTLQNTQSPQQLKIQPGVSKNFASQVMSKFGIKPGMTQEEINIAKIKAIMAQKQWEIAQEQLQKQNTTQSKGFLLIPGSAHSVMQAKMQGQKNKSGTSKNKHKSEEKTCPTTTSSTANSKSTFQNVASHDGYAYVNQMIQSTRPQTATKTTKIDLAKQPTYNLGAQPIVTTVLPVTTTTDNKLSTTSSNKTFREVDIQHALHSLSKVLDKSSILIQNPIFQGKYKKSVQEKVSSQPPVRPTSAMPSLMSSTTIVVTTQADSTVLQSFQGQNVTTFMPSQKNQHGQNLSGQNSAYQLLYLGQIKTGSLTETGQMVSQQTPPVQLPSGSKTAANSSVQISGQGSTVLSVSNLPIGGQTQIGHTPTTQNIPLLCAQNIGIQNVIPQNMMVQGIAAQPNIQGVSAQPLAIRTMGSQNLTVQGLCAQAMGAQTLNPQNIMFQGIGTQPIGIQTGNTQNLSIPSFNVQEMGNFSGNLQPNQQIGMTYQTLDTNSQMLASTNQVSTLIDLQGLAGTSQTVGTSNQHVSGFGMNIKRGVSDTSVTFATSAGLMTSKVSTPGSIVPLNSQQCTTLGNLGLSSTNLTFTPTAISTPMNFIATNVGNVSNILQGGSIISASTMGVSQQLPIVSSYNLVSPNYTSQQFTYQQGEMGSNNALQTPSSSSLNALIGMPTPGNIVSCSYTSTSPSVTTSTSSITAQPVPILPKTSPSNVVVGPFQLVVDTNAANTVTSSFVSVNTNGISIPITTSQNISSMNIHNNFVTLSGTGGTDVATKPTHALPLVSNNQCQSPMLEAMLIKGKGKGIDKPQKVSNQGLNSKRSNGLEIVRRVSLSEMQSNTVSAQNWLETSNSSTPFCGSALQGQDSTSGLSSTLVSESDLNLLGNTTNTLENLLRNPEPEITSVAGINVVDVHITTCNKKQDDGPQKTVVKNSDNVDDLNVNQDMSMPPKMSSAKESESKLLSNTIQDNFWKDLNRFKERMASTKLSNSLVSTKSQDVSFSDNDSNEQASRNKVPEPDPSNLVQKNELCSTHNIENELTFSSGIEGQSNKTINAEEMPPTDFKTLNSEIVPNNVSDFDVNGIENRQQESGALPHTAITSIYVGKNVGVDIFEDAHQTLPDSVDSLSKSVNSETKVLGTGTCDLKSDTLQCQSNDELKSAVNGPIELKIDSECSHTDLKQEIEMVENRVHFENDQSDKIKCSNKIIDLQARTNVDLCFSDVPTEDMSESTALEFRADMKDFIEDDKNAAVLSQKSELSVTGTQSSLVIGNSDCGERDVIGTEIFQEKLASENKQNNYKSSGDIMCTDTGMPEDSQEKKTEIVAKPLIKIVEYSETSDSEVELESISPKFDTSEKNENIDIFSVKGRKAIHISEKVEKHEEDQIHIHNAEMKQDSLNGLIQSSSYSDVQEYPATESGPIHVSDKEDETNGPQSDLFENNAGHEKVEASTACVIESQPPVSPFTKPESLNEDNSLSEKADALKVSVDVCPEKSESGDVLKFKEIEQNLLKHFKAETNILVNDVAILDTTDQVKEINKNINEEDMCLKSENVYISSVENENLNLNTEQEIGDASGHSGDELEVTGDKSEIKKPIYGSLLETNEQIISDKESALPQKDNQKLSLEKEPVLSTPPKHDLMSNYKKVMDEILNLSASKHSVDDDGDRFSASRSFGFDELEMNERRQNGTKDNCEESLRIFADSLMKLPEISSFSPHLARSLPDDWSPGQGSQKTLKRSISNEERSLKRSFSDMDLSQSDGNLSDFDTQSVISDREYEGKTMNKLCSSSGRFRSNVLKSQKSPTHTVSNICYKYNHPGKYSIALPQLGVRHKKVKPESCLLKYSEWKNKEYTPEIITQPAAPVKKKTFDEPKSDNKEKEIDQKCLICQQTFSNLDDLRQHVINPCRPPDIRKIVMEVKELSYETYYTCFQCKNVEKTEFAAKRHSDTCFKFRLTDEKSYDMDTIFRCKMCGESFRYQKTACEHITFHCKRIHKQKPILTVLSAADDPEAKKDKVSASSPAKSENYVKCIEKTTCSKNLDMYKESHKFSQIEKGDKETEMKENGEKSAIVSTNVEGIKTYVDVGESARAVNETVDSKGAVIENEETIKDADELLSVKIKHSLKSLKNEMEKEIDNESVKSFTTESSYVTIDASETSSIKSGEYKSRSGQQKHSARLISKQIGKRVIKVKKFFGDQFEVPDFVETQVKRANLKRKLKNKSGFSISPKFRRSLRKRGQSNAKKKLKLTQQRHNNSKSICIKHAKTDEEKIKATVHNLKHKNEAQPSVQYEDILKVTNYPLNKFTETDSKELLQDLLCEKAGRTVIRCPIRDCRTCTRTEKAMMLHIENHHLTERYKPSKSQVYECKYCQLHFKCHDDIVVHSSDHYIQFVVDNLKFCALNVVLSLCSLIDKKESLTNQEANESNSDIKKEEAETSSECENNDKLASLKKGNIKFEDSGSVKKKTSKIRENQTSPNQDLKLESSGENLVKKTKFKRAKQISSELDQGHERRSTRKQSCSAVVEELMKDKTEATKQPKGTTEENISFSESEEMDKMIDCFSSPDSSVLRRSSRRKTDGFSVYKDFEMPNTGKKQPKLIDENHITENEQGQGHSGTESDLKPQEKDEEIELSRKRLNTRSSKKLDVSESSSRKTPKIRNAEVKEMKSEDSELHSTRNNRKRHLSFESNSSKTSEAKESKLENSEVLQTRNTRQRRSSFESNSSAAKSEIIDATKKEKSAEDIVETNKTEKSAEDVVETNKTEKSAEDLIDTNRTGKSAEDGISKIIVKKRRTGPDQELIAENRSLSIQSTRKRRMSFSSNVGLNSRKKSTSSTNLSRKKNVKNCSTEEKAKTRSGNKLDHSEISLVEKVDTGKDEKDTQNAFLDSFKKFIGTSTKLDTNQLRSLKQGKSNKLKAQAIMQHRKQTLRKSKVIKNVKMEIEQKSRNMVEIVDLIEIKDFRKLNKDQQKLAADHMQFIDLTDEKCLDSKNEEKEEEIKTTNFNAGSIATNNSKTPSFLDSFLAHVNVTEGKLCAVIPPTTMANGKKINDLLKTDEVNTTEDVQMNENCQNENDDSAKSMAKKADDNQGKNCDEKKKLKKELKCSTKKVKTGHSKGPQDTSSEAQFETASSKHQSRRSQKKAAVTKKERKNDIERPKEQDSAKNTSDKRKRRSSKEESSDKRKEDVQQSKSPDTSFQESFLSYIHVDSNSVIPANQKVTSSSNTLQVENEKTLKLSRKKSPFKWDLDDDDSDGKLSVIKKTAVDSKNQSEFQSELTEVKIEINPQKSAEKKLNVITENKISRSSGSKFSKVSEICERKRVSKQDKSPKGSKQEGVRFDQSLETKNEKGDANTVKVSGSQLDASVLIPPLKKPNTDFEKHFVQFVSTALNKNVECMDTHNEESQQDVESFVLNDENYDSKHGEEIAEKCAIAVNSATINSSKPSETGDFKKVVMETKSVSSTLDHSPLKSKHTRSSLDSSLLSRQFFKGASCSKSGGKLTPSYNVPTPQSKKINYSTKSVAYRKTTTNKKLIPIAVLDSINSSEFKKNLDLNKLKTKVKSSPASGSLILSETNKPPKTEDLEKECTPPTSDGTVNASKHKLVPIHKVRHLYHGGKVWQIGQGSVSSMNLAHPSTQQLDPIESVIENTCLEVNNLTNNGQQLEQISESIKNDSDVLAEKVKEGEKQSRWKARKSPQKRPPAKDSNIHHGKRSRNT